MKNNYTLINPQIKGNLDTSVKSSNSMRAMRKIYDKVSQYFTSPVQSIYMTIRNDDRNEMHHFHITEKNKSESNKVSYLISRLEGNFPDKINNELLKKSSNVMDGGNIDDLYDELEDSSSEYEIDNYQSPIDFYTFYWLPYYTLRTQYLSKNDYHRIIIPKFVNYVEPKVEINFKIMATFE